VVSALVLVALAVAGAGGPPGTASEAELGGLPELRQADGPGGDGPRTARQGRPDTDEGSL